MEKKYHMHKKEESDYWAQCLWPWKQVTKERRKREGRNNIMGENIWSSSGFLLYNFS